MERHLTMIELQAELDALGQSPQDQGTLEMIVCRPAIDERLVMEQAELHLVEGLVGDNWHARGSSHTVNGRADPETQITLMNARVIQTLARDRERWPLAGDQLYVDLDLSYENLQPGHQLAIGTAVLEITVIPHTGCAKFTERFGHDAIRFVNSGEGRRHRRRGIYARVIQPGAIRVGDTILVKRRPG